MSHDSHASPRPASTTPFVAARPTGMVSPGTQPLRSRTTRQPTPLPVATTFGNSQSHHTPNPIPPTDIGIPSSIQRRSNAITSTLQQITSPGWLSDPLPIALDEIYRNTLMLNDITCSFALNLNPVSYTHLTLPTTPYV